MNLEVIYYYQDSCTACDTFDPMWESHQEKHIGDPVDFIRRNVTNADPLHRISATPTVIIQLDGNILATLQAPTERELHGAITNGLALIQPEGGSSSLSNPIWVNLAYAGAAYFIFKKFL